MFELYSAAQYRALEFDALEERRSAIAAELESENPTASYEDLREQVRMCREEVDRRAMAAEMRRAQVAAASSSTNVIASYAGGRNVHAADEVDVYDTEEYRRAFYSYCTRGVPMPEFRTNDTGTIIATPTVTTGVSPQVPSTMQRGIVSKMEEYGDIWNSVRKLSVQGGVWFRVLDLNPTATWLQKGSGNSELTVSGYQGVTNDATISFSFYELECRMSQSLLAQATTYADFQALFVPAVAKAMVKALEAAIMNGDGTGQFLGLTNDARITNVVSMTKADIADWQKWHTKVDAAILPEYDNGSWIMSKATWNKYIDTMANNSTDKTPVAEFHYDPVSGKRVTTLMGKPVKLVSTSILPDVDTASTGAVFAVYGNLSDYVVNTQPGMPMSTVRWVDHETNTEKIKSIMAADGKVLDPYGFMLLKLGA